MCSRVRHGEMDRGAAVAAEAAVTGVAVDRSFAGPVTSQGTPVESAHSVSRKTDRGRAYRA